VIFKWTEKAEAAFILLKKMFTTAPILVQFDPDRETVVEADSSGWATGGVLSQYDNDGLLHPCAYFSRKNAPAECNYEIHNKELLAIINCLREWEPELSSLAYFKIITDHKNLRYFTTLRRLNERQMRWADTLSRYSFDLEYRPGKLAIRPDALSRREQDMPEEDDERLKHREVRLFNPKALKPGGIRAFAIRVSAMTRSRVAADKLTAPRSLNVTGEQLVQETAVEGGGG
jgi:RNase H-like domain found in reverse transcriptase